VGYFDTMMRGDVMSAAMGTMSSFDSGLTSGTGFFTVARISEYLSGLNVTDSITGFLVSVLNSLPVIINHSGVLILIFLSGLQSVSPSVYEAAQIEGATGWVSFWKITMPMLSPMVLVNMLYCIVDYFTHSGNAIMRNIYDVSFASNHFGQGSAMAWVYFGVLIVVLTAVYLLGQRFVFYQERG